MQELVQTHTVTVWSGAQKTYRDTRLEAIKMSEDGDSWPNPHWAHEPYAIACGLDSTEEASLWLVRMTDRQTGKPPEKVVVGFKLTREREEQDGYHLELDLTQHHWDEFIIVPSSGQRTTYQRPWPGNCRCANQGFPSLNCR